MLWREIFKISDRWHIGIACDTPQFWHLATAADASIIIIISVWRDRMILEIK
jgi:hypothetical protein